MATTNKSVGKAELKGVLKASVEDDKEWRTELKERFGIETLPHYFAYGGGVLRKEGEKEAAALKEMAEKITNAGTTSLKNKSKEALEMSLHLITDSGRVRLPDCLKAQHAAVGRLSTDNKKVVPMESDKLWGLVADQRGGRAVPDHTRGNTKLLRQMWAPNNFSSGLQ